MVLIVEPATEDIEATVLWPGRGIGEPTSQLLDKNLLAKFAQDVVASATGCLMLSGQSQQQR
jgi:hypothetical protein